MQPQHHGHVQNSPSLLPLQTQIKLVHTLPSYLFMIHLNHFNIILKSMSKCPFAIPLDIWKDMSKSKAPCNNSQYVDN